MGGSGGVSNFGGWHVLESSPMASVSRLQAQVLMGHVQV